MAGTFGCICETVSPRGLGMVVWQVDCGWRCGRGVKSITFRGAALPAISSCVRRRPKHLFLDSSMASLVAHFCCCGNNMQVTTQLRANVISGLAHICALPWHTSVRSPEGVGSSSPASPWLFELACGDAPLMSRMTTSIVAATSVAML